MRVKEAFFSDKKRWLSGLVLTLVTAGVVFSSIKELVYIFFGVALLVAVYEAGRFGGVERSFSLYLAVVAIWTGGYFFPEFAIELPLLALLLTSIPIIFGVHRFKNISLILLYPTIPFLAVISMYTLYDKGAWLLFVLFVGVAFSDMGAYFGGRSFGKHKLAPSISPGKTIEGALAGVVAGSLAGLLSILAIFSNFTTLEAIATGVVISLFAVVGDLFESFLKRSVGRKDSGSIFPGHGGMLDRTDGILFSAVALYFVLKVIY